MFEKVQFSKTTKNDVWFPFYKPQPGGEIDATIMIDLRECLLIIFITKDLECFTHSAGVSVHILKS